MAAGSIPRYVHGIPTNLPCYPDLIKTISLIVFSSVLLSCNASSLSSVFDAYAQTQSGPATSGSATSGPYTLYCNATNACSFGGPTSGPANSGSATSTGETAPYASDIPPIDGVPCYNIIHHMKTAIHFHTHLDIFVNGVNLTIPQNIGLLPDKCFYALHTHDSTGMIHVESQTKDNFVLGMFFDIWGNNFYDTMRTYGNPSVTKVYVNGQEVNNMDYRQIPLKPYDEIVIVYGNSPDNIPSNYSGFIY